MCLKSVTIMSVYSSDLCCITCLHGDHGDHFCVAPQCFLMDPLSASEVCVHAFLLIPIHSPNPICVMHYTVCDCFLYFMLD